MRRWEAALTVIAVVAMTSSAAAQPGTHVEPSDAQFSGAGEGRVEAQVTPIPLTVDVRLSRDSVAVGQQVTVRTFILNQSDTEVSAVSAEIRLEGPVQVIGEASQSVGTIGPDKRANLGWRACGAEAGAVIGVVAVEGTLESGGPFAVESPAFLLTVTESTASRGCGVGG